MAGSGAKPARACDSKCASQAHLTLGPLSGFTLIPTSHHGRRPDEHGANHETGIGSAATHRSVTIKLAVETQLPVLSLDYRLAPEAPVPVRARRCAGDSAGGNLPAGAILFSSWLDLAVASWNSAASLPLSRAAMESAARMYVRARNAEEPLVSPSRAELHSLPPMQILVSDAESVFDDACRLVQRIRAAGRSADLAVWHGMPHAWPCFAPFLPEAGDALAHAAQFARQCIGVTTDLG